MTFRDQMGSDLENAFFSEGDFAEAATYYPVSGDPYPLSVIFDSNYTEVDPNTQTVISSSSPKAAVQESKIIGGVKEKDEIEIGGKRYRIKDKQSDGTGVIDLILHLR